VSLRAFRVGVVGARRARRGVGAHLARLFHAAGTKVVAVAGTSAATAAEAARALADLHGIEAAPYDDPARMVREAGLDALVVASPHATHVPLLALALAARLHVLCEKPLAWGTVDAPARGERLVAAYAAADLCLAVNTPLRHTLATYLQLFPDVNPRAARTFVLEASPPSTGDDMLPDALPHPLALLDHLWPAATLGLRDVHVDRPDDRHAVVRFVHPGRDVACEVRLTTVPEPPRPLAYAFDGVWARRVIREPGYRLALTTASGDREVGLPDPMGTLVHQFVARVRKGPPFLPEPTAVPGLRHLHDVLSAWPPIGVARRPGAG